MVLRTNEDHLAYRPQSEPDEKVHGLRLHVIQRRRSWSPHPSEAEVDRVFERALEETALEAFAGALN